MFKSEMKSYMYQEILDLSIPPTCLGSGNKRGVSILSCVALHRLLIHCIKYYSLLFSNRCRNRRHSSCVGRRRPGSVGRGREGIRR